MENYLIHRKQIPAVNIGTVGTDISHHAFVFVVVDDVVGNYGTFLPGMFSLISFSASLKEIPGRVFCTTEITFAGTSDKGISTSSLLSKQALSVNVVKITMADIFSVVIDLLAVFIGFLF